MTNAWYDKVLTKVGRGQLDLNTLTAPKVIAIESGLYTFNQAHEFLSDIPIGARMAIKALTSPTFGTPEGWFDGADVTFDEPVGAAATAPTDYVGYWTYDIADISAPTIDDVSGSANVHDATMINTPTTGVVGKVGEAIIFDSASTEYATLVDHADFQPTNFTVATWGKATLEAATTHLFTSWNTITTGTLNYGFSLNVNATGQVVVEIGSGITATELIASDTIIADGQFHHLGGTYDGTKLKIYVDGLLENEFTVTNGLVYNATNFVRIAAIEKQAGVSNTLNGWMDDTKFYTRAVTGAEMKALAGVTPTVKELIIFEDSGTEATSPLLLFVDNANILPIIPEAGKDLEVQWQGTAIARL